MSLLQRFILAYVSGMLLSAACSSESRDAPSGDFNLGSVGCADFDGDGVSAGPSCAGTTDCDDADPAVTTECSLCARPWQGCQCPEGVEPLDCTLAPRVLEGVTACFGGKRYCRNGRWSGCESIHEYRLRESRESVVSQAQALITGPTKCNACNPVCAQTQDYPADGDLVAGDVTDPNANQTNLDYDEVKGLTLILEDTTGGGGAGSLTDADMDGLSVLCDADDGSAGNTNTVNGGQCHELALGASEVGSQDIDVRIRSADVYVLVDKTGSMQGEIDNLTASLTSGDFVTPIDPALAASAPCNSYADQGVIGAIKCQIPDAWIGVGTLSDYPVKDNIYASWDEDYMDAGYNHLVNIVDPDMGQAQLIQAVNALYANGGGEYLPEGTSQTLYSLATGRALYPVVGPQLSCPAGRWGYPCFRSGIVPILLIVTDAQIHNGPDPAVDAYLETRYLRWEDQLIVRGNNSKDNAYDLGDLTNHFMSVGGNTRSMGNAASTLSPGFSCGPADGEYAVYKFSISGGSPVSIYATTEQSGFDTILEIRDASFNPITCVDDNAGGTGTAAHYYSRISTTLNAGTYYALVSGQKVTVPPPPIPADDDTDPLESADAHHGHYRLNIGRRPSATAVGESYAIGSIDADVFRFSGTTTGKAMDVPRDAAQWCSEKRGAAAPDVVFSFSTTGGQVMIDTLGSDFDTIIEVRDSTGTIVDCKNDGMYGGKDILQYGYGRQSWMARNLPAGNYTLIVSGHNGATGNFRLTIGALKKVAFRKMSGAGNEDQATAYSLGDITHQERRLWGTTAGMTNDYTNWVIGATNPSCDTTTAPDAVYKFTISQPNTPVRIDLKNSAYDTMLSLRDATFNEVACNDDYVGQGNKSRIDAVLGVGTYYVVVDGWSSASGYYELRIGNMEQTFPVQWADAVTAMQNAGIKVATVTSCDGDPGMAGINCPGTKSAYTTLANVTGSVDSLGSPFIYAADYTGAGVDASVVDGVVALANAARMDISLVALDNPATPGVDESQFVVNPIAAVSYGPGQCTGISGGTVFTDCLPGADVNFNVVFQNNIIASTNVPQTFDFELAVIGDGTYELQRVPARVVVPPTGGAPAFTEGRYWRNVDGSTYCEGTERPHWGLLSWNVNTPANTEIRFEIRQADSFEGLSTATPIPLAVPPTASPQSLATLLASNGQSTVSYFLRITTILRSLDGVTSPEFSGFTVDFDCLPVQ